MINFQKNRINKVINKEVHSEAEKVFLQYANDFSTSLMLQAKWIAHNSKADVVLSVHMHEALEAMNDKSRKKVWLRESAKILGSALVGAFMTPLQKRLDKTRPNCTLLNWRIV